MEDYIVYVIGFFVPIALAYGAGYLAGIGHEKRARAHEQKPTIQAVVVTVIPEYQQVKVLTPERRQYTIGRKTQGVDWSILKLGDRLEIKVEDGIIREAKLLP